MPRSSEGGGLAECWTEPQRNPFYEDVTGEKTLPQGGGENRTTKTRPERRMNGGWEGREKGTEGSLKV